MFYKEYQFPKRKVDYDALLSVDCLLPVFAGQTDNTNVTMHVMRYRRLGFDEVEPELEKVRHICLHRGNYPSCQSYVSNETRTSH